MSSSYSPNLNLELIGTGDQSGSWGVTTNYNWGEIEEAVSGYVSVAVTTGSTTTLTIPTGPSSAPYAVARNMYIKLTGTGGASTYVHVPTNKKLYFIHNNTTGAVTVRVASLTGVSVPAGAKYILLCDGTDVVDAASYLLGSGTTNYVPKFTTSSTIGNSVIYDDGTNVGIGTSTPNASFKLDVVGSIRSSATLELNNGTLSGIFGLNSFNTSVLGIGSTNNIPFVLGTNSVERMRIDSSGNVGIGTSSPQVKLQVAGGGAVFQGSSFPTSGSGLEVVWDGTESVLQSFNRTASTYQPMWLESSTTRFGINGNERMRIDSSGNVGIGYSSLSGTSNLCVSGSIGIGTTAPSARLYLAAPAGGTTTLFLAGISTITNGFTINTDASNNIAYSFLTKTGAQGIYQDASGNVGIGTSSPVSQAKLTVNGAITTTAQCPAGGNISPYFDRYDVVGTGSGRIVCEATNGVFTIWTQAAERMRIDSSGNVGIGTTTPSKKLDVNGDASINGVRVGLGNNNVANNVVLGSGSALGSITTGNNNTTIGASSLSGLTTGNDNVAIGLSALYYLATGSGNTAVGALAASESQSSGSNNTYLGYYAGQYNSSSNNIALGAFALTDYYSYSGNSNIAIGYSAIYDGSSGNYNIAIGHSAYQDGGTTTKTGSKNVLIGYTAGAGFGGESNCVVIGGYAGGAVSNSIIIADGTGTIRSYYDGANNTFDFRTSGTIRLSISSGGVVAITNLAGTGSRTVTANASGQLSAASDSSLKQEVIGAALPGLSEIMQVQPRAYKWLSDIENRGDNAATEIGFFANEVASIIPSAAPQGEDGLYGFYDRSMLAALVKAVQELKSELDSVKAELQSLKGN